MFSCCDCYTAEELLEGVRIYQEENVIQAIEEAGYFCEAHFGANHQIVYYKCYFVPVPEKQRVCNQQRIKEQEEQRKKERRWDILETSLTIFALLFFLLWGTFCVVSSIH